LRNVIVPVPETNKRDRFHCRLLIVSFLPLCWLLMMVIHEVGHVLAAWLTGGRVAGVVVHPLTISRTDLAENPHPLLVAWSGPIFGVVVPLAAMGIWQIARLPGWPLVRFFAGFCLVANGAYLSIGSFGRVGDAGTVLSHGSPIWTLWVFGAVAVPAGLWCWHRLGPHFGIGPCAEVVSPVTAWSSVGLLVVLVILQLLVSA
jgi:hypothetical protein